MQSHGILTPMQGQIEGQNNFDEPGAEHFVTPKGVSSLVKYFLEKGSKSRLFLANINWILSFRSQTIYSLYIYIYTLFTTINV